MRHGLTVRPVKSRRPRPIDGVLSRTCLSAEDYNFVIHTLHRPTRRQTSCNIGLGGFPIRCSPPAAEPRLDKHWANSAFFVPKWALNLETSFSGCG
jgi:hypothetical protein